MWFKANLSKTLTIRSSSENPSAAHTDVLPGTSAINVKFINPFPVSTQFTKNSQSGGEQQ